MRAKGLRPCWRRSAQRMVASLFLPTTGVGLMRAMVVQVPAEFLWPRSCGANTHPHSGERRWE